MSEKVLLQVKDLHTSFNVPSGEVRSVNGVSLTVNRGEVVGIVGESGSGKSVTAYSIMQILEKPGRVIGGSIRFEDKEMLNIPHKQLQKIRGQRMAIVFQDSMSSLNPVWTIGNQLREVIKVHQNAPIIQAEYQKITTAKKKLKNKEGDLKTLKAELKKARRNYKEFIDNRCLEMLQLVGINEPEKRLKQYPYEFSGGMLQRIMIAMALMCEPDLIIADEPTTALDVTIQAQILELLLSIQQKMKMGIIIITHDLGVVAQVCDRVNVMYAGRIVESGSVRDIFYNPQHEYTKGLLNSIPKLNVKVDRLEPIVGNPVDVFRLPNGCSFAPRCASCMQVCLQRYPEHFPVTEDGTHTTACFKYVKTMLEKKKISEGEFQTYLNSCAEGNKAFKEISRLDVYEALLDYQKAKKVYSEVKNQDISKEEKEIYKYRAAEQRQNYFRAKRDLALAKKTYRDSKSEKLSIDKNDVRKKVHHHKVEVAAFAKGMSRVDFDAYLADLIICTSPVNAAITKNDVMAYKKTFHEAVKKHWKKKYKTLSEKVEALNDIDELRYAYDRAVLDLKWKKYIEKKLVATRTSLTKIYLKKNGLRKGDVV